MDPDQTALLISLIRIHSVCFHDKIMTKLRVNLLIEQGCIVTFVRGHRLQFLKYINFSVPEDYFLLWQTAQTLMVVFTTH